MIKNEIRRQIKEIIKTECNKPGYKNQAARSVYEKITGSQTYQNSPAILGYMALNDELDITSCLEDALKAGKKVALPRILGDSMDFFWIDNISQVNEGSFSILEPEDNGNPVTPTELKDALILVPGRAFTQNGKRLGRGKGYYDKWFSRMRLSQSSKEFTKWGVCFSCQIVQDIPADENDIPMDKIISD